MDGAREPNVGARLRGIRDRKGYSLRTLAERSGLSVNAISLIERGENSPTVSSLHLLARALEVGVTDFFTEEHRLTAVYTPASERLRYRSPKMWMESLGIGLHNQDLQPFMISVPPHAPIAESVTHPGEEFVYCLAGEIDYAVDETWYSMAPGDTLLLDARWPHRFTNPGSGHAQILIVFQASGHEHLARDRHLHA